MANKDNVQDILDTFGPDNFLLFHHVGSELDRPKGSIYGRFYNEFDPDAAMFNLDEWRCVAAVDCEDVEDVFRLTNHINSDWRDNFEVTWHLRGECGHGLRSTSVGDVVRTPDGRWLLVAGAGWEDITPIALVACPAA